MIPVTKDTFEKEVLKRKGKVLVDFNASWCGPCRMLQPVLEELEKENKNCTFASINVDDNEELSQECGVMSIPCLVLFEDGKEIDRSVGFKSLEELKEMIGE
ncbi:MAG: thioredoxin [Bacilli bacterium]|nr:thioredoxin [Bacilli bacterium]